MAIRYTPEYNAEIRRRVHNFNQNRKRAELAGVPKNRLPNPVKVSELKANIKTKSELERVLNQLDKFSKKATNDRINVGEDFKTTKWNYDYLKINRNLAKEYFENEYKRVEKRVSQLPGERNYLDTISAKIELLSKDINTLEDREFRASLNAVNEFMQAPSQRKTAYRSYLTVVEEVMDTLNIDKATKDAFFKKFEQLTPTQFLYMYDNNALIERVYELYFKRTENGEVQLNTDVNSANEIIEELLEQADLMVEDAKLNSV